MATDNASGTHATAGSNFVRIEADQCKGCRLCVETCPNHCLSIGSRINNLGYQHARFQADQCTACGLCFYVCPEPGAITVYADATPEEIAS